MRNYIIKRLGMGVVLLFCVSFLVFSMLYLMPGDPVTLMAGPLVKAENLEGLRIQYGLDRPLLVQYAEWMTNIIFHGDFGISYKYRIAVWSLLKNCIPISLKLTVTTMLISTIVAIPLGLMCAYKKDSLFDRITVNISLVFTAIPSFWLAVLLMLVFAVKLKWLPLSGYESWKNYILPVTTGVIGGLASTIRLTKSEALDVLREKFVTTAYAKGLDNNTVLKRHVLRNSLIVITVNMFMSLPWLISGYIVIEKIFGIPGMGNLMINSIIQQDFNVVQACILIITVLTIICNILSDIVLGILDPRIRISVTGGDK
ncbi:Glutathione transport system permease protein GsiC [bioreactor metagenome]|jgi:peptide/nickel transport system permease protein|uniref:Glutathione transport system permease protein GsiC n=1 Tax=bioreactor metagenome TaxID=1076179 RepID=A0A644X1E3_9ZZZZ|nr:ABC transporter permease [Sedimentibacter saalensis]MEA5095518.1 ABC transporter permease [Sedimentibacter saalensis]